MPHSAILFDLWGTLVAPFRRAEHMEAIRGCADLLGIAYDDCHRHWVASFPDRIRGHFRSVADNFSWILQESGSEASADRVDRAEALYDEFTLAGLSPMPGTIEALGRLKEKGLRIGLVTNCAPDVPRLWSRTPFAPFFDHCSYSCIVGAVKPDPAIYLDAIDALDLDPRAVLYVGDGSDQELSGAAALGMEPVLIRRDLSNTYDTSRSDVDAWQGRVITALEELGLTPPSLEYKRGG